MTTKIQEKIVIGEGENTKVFISNKWDCLKAARMLPKIGKMFAVPISFLYSSKEEQDLEDAIPKASYMLFEQLDDADLADFFNTVLCDVWIENGTERIDINRDIDDIEDLLYIVSRVIMQNYGALTKGKGLRSLIQSVAPVAMVSE